MGVAATGVGHFQIPTAPAAGTSVTSGAAGVLTGTAIVLSASTSAIFITGVHVEQAAASAATYTLVQLCQGGSGAETAIGQYLVPLSTGSTVALGFHPIFPPLKVASATRLTVKTADSVGAKASLITVEAILQSNVIDDGIAVATVTTVTNQLTAAAVATGVWQDATAGDFTTASSIGKALYIANIAPGGSGGHLISGVNSGTVTFGAFTITGVTTQTGNVIYSDGITISAPSTTNRAGIDITGNGTGAAIKGVAGATGIGLSLAGGGTSGDGLKITTTSGHGINLAPVGTSMHGLFATGGNGGTSDGIKAAAGTGGVDIRGNITGNLVGTVSTLTTYTGNTVQTGDSFARIGAAGAGLTALGDSRIANLDAAVTTRSTYAGADTAGTTTLLGRLSAVRAVNLDILSLRNATAQAGAAGSITLDLSASATNSIYNGLWVVIESGTGAGQSRLITGYTGATQVATVAPNWTTNPDSTSVFGLFPAAKITGVTLTDTVTTYTGNTVQTGDSFARIGAAGAGLTALGDVRIANLDGTVTSRMASYTQPTGFLAATFPSGTVANTTNITAGVITTATNLTTNNDKTGYALSSAGVQAIWDALTTALTTVGSIGKKIADWAVNADTAGTTTLLGRLSAARAVNLDALSLRNATAQAGAAGSITLDASASATDDLYKGLWVMIESGTGAGQVRLITGYTGLTQVATVAPNWATNPDLTSVFALVPAGKVSGVTLADALTGYTAPDNTSIAAIKVQTDKFAFTIANQVNSNICSVNGTTVTGDGQPGSEWGS